MLTGLTDIDYDSVMCVALNMREVDEVEILNVLDIDTKYDFGRLAFGALRNSGRGRVAWHKGRPAAVIGLIEERPRIWQITMFGTDDLRHVAFLCMRWARETLREFASPPFNGRRLHCDSRVGHDEAHRFLRALGACEEGPPMKHFGKDGGDYQRFVWLIGENDHVLSREPARHAGRADAQREDAGAEPA
jgi:hypothetical protein